MPKESLHMETAAQDACSATPLSQLVARVPLGYTEVLFTGVRYGLTRTDHNAGRSSKIFARALKGTDFISLNYYTVGRKEWLKPCEMAPEKVLAFLAEFEFQPES